MLGWLCLFCGLSRRSFLILLLRAPRDVNQFKDKEDGKAVCTPPALVLCLHWLDMHCSGYDTSIRMNYSNLKRRSRSYCVLSTKSVLQDIQEVLHSH